MNPELVLVVGDMFVPQRSPDISDQLNQFSSQTSSSTSYP